jgi:pyoverdine/dityrosine biosynthesis protein Dit1/AcrR family transcriptional regulator
MTNLDTENRRTRQRLLEAAISLLTSRGLSSGLLTDAAATINCPLNRAQIYFRRDEDIILALYARLAADFETCVPDFPEASLAERFRAAMLAKLTIVAPYREALAALLATLLDPRHELGALNEQTEIIRSRVMTVFSAVALGATDRPKMEIGQLTRSLYAAHLTLMLLWTQDRSPESLATRAALDIVCNLLSMSGKLLWLPNVKATLEKLDQLSTLLIEPIIDDSNNQLSIEILRRLFRYRRLQPTAGACAQNPCEQCLALHLPKVRRFVTAREPIHMLLPAFPAKSPSLKKVIGALPDLAEEIALTFLQRICNELKEIYPPGVRITICSDGRVFSDLVGVSDKNVTEYGREIALMLHRLKAGSLDTFSMEDLFETADHTAMRDQLCALYANPLSVIEERARNHEHHRALFNGIQRFLFEDRLGMESELSKSQVRNQCKDRAYKVIQRSDAWGRLLTECFPTALRLSIHPQGPHSDKIGILLGDASDAWVTPWHGVAVEDQGKFKLMRRHEAEALGAHLVEHAGRPSHYQIRGNQ